MIFQCEKSLSGGLVYGYEEGWHWSRDKGHYHTHCDFFAVHWEVHDKDPNHVRLHVESPRNAIDPTLNGIKQATVQALLAPHIRQTIEQRGYAYKVGCRTKSDHMQRNKSTEPFRIVLTEEQSQSTAQENIEAVNSKLGDIVREIVDKFAPQLKQCSLRPVCEPRA